MSRLEDLIAELCPDGVEYRTLAEIGDFFGGLTGKSKDDFSNGNRKFISYMNVFSNLSINTKVIDLVKIQEEEKQRIIKNGDIIFTGSSETPHECGMSSVFINDKDEEFYLNSFCFGLRLYDENLLLPHFSKYLFRSNELRTQIIKTASGVTRFNVSKKKMGNVLVPLPPLLVQQEIVRILDNFTELTKELTKELTVRKQQYEYYRDSLLTFGDDVKWKTLGEVAEFRYGFTDKSKDKGTARFVRITDIGANGKLQRTNCKYVELTKDSKNYLLQKGDLLMARTGATYGKTMLFEDNGPAVFASFLIRIRFNNDTVLPGYYWHFAQSRLYWNQANKLVSKAGQPQFNANVLKNIMILVPPLSEQERIVTILDRFDTLVNDITTGLPAEIEARKQQYEYYRDKLLTFKERVL